MAGLEGGSQGALQFPTFKLQQPRAHSRSRLWLDEVLIIWRRSREKERGELGGREKKIKLFSEIMVNVEIWLVLNRNLQFSSLLFLEENVSCWNIQGSLMTSLPMAAPRSLQHALVHP